LAARNLPEVALEFIPKFFGVEEVDGHSTRSISPSLVLLLNFSCQRYFSASSIFTFCLPTSIYYPHRIHYY
jgi:hypothetical protein